MLQHRKHLHTLSGYRIKHRQNRSKRLPPGGVKFDRIYTTELYSCRRVENNVVFIIRVLHYLLLVLSSAVNSEQCITHVVGRTCKELCNTGKQGY